MMQSNFKTVFNIEILHTYFEKNICNCIGFEPCPATKSLIQRFGFVIRKQINGFELFADTRNDVTLLLNYIKTATNAACFNFDMRSTDGNFVYFTELPINYSGPLLYDSQCAKNITNAAGTQLSENFDNSNSAAHLGSLTIYFDDVINSLSSKKNARFTINYTARATQWQYLVINKSNVPFNNPAVVSKTDIAFNHPEKVNLENGEHALLFSSGENLIPLSKVPRYHFDLVNNGYVNGSDFTKKALSQKMIFKNLPSPTPQRISITKTATNNRVSSLIYVYV